MRGLLGSLERAAKEILDQASAGDTRKPPIRERLRRCFPESGQRDDSCYPNPEQPEEGCFPQR